MNEEKKNKKPYQPPRIYDISVDPRQAMGISGCATGGTATQNCLSGPNATIPSCGGGFGDADGCTSGLVARSLCRAGWWNG